MAQWATGVLLVNTMCCPITFTMHRHMKVCSGYRTKTSEPQWRLCKVINTKWDWACFKYCQVLPSGTGHALSIAKYCQVGLGMLCPLPILRPRQNYPLHHRTELVFPVFVSFATRLPDFGAEGNCSNTPLFSNCVHFCIAHIAQWQQRSQIFFCLQAPCTRRFVRTGLCLTVTGLCTTTATTTGPSTAGRGSTTTPPSPPRDASTSTASTQLERDARPLSSR